MKREFSSTKWNRVYINEPLIALVREAWLNAITKPEVKIAKQIQKTCYPDGTTKYHHREPQEV
jgi:hypothetical protein